MRVPDISSEVKNERKEEIRVSMDSEALTSANTLCRDAEQILVSCKECISECWHDVVGESHGSPDHITSAIIRSSAVDRPLRFR